MGRAACTSMQSPSQKTPVTNNFHFVFQVASAYIYLWDRWASSGLQKENGTKGASTRCRMATLLRHCALVLPFGNIKAQRSNCPYCAVSARHSSILLLRHRRGTLYWGGTPLWQLSCPSHVDPSDRFIAAACCMAL